MTETVKRLTQVYCNHDCYFLFIHSFEYVISDKEFRLNVSSCYHSDGLLVSSDLPSRS